MIVFDVIREITMIAATKVKTQTPITTVALLVRLAKMCWEA